MKRRPLFLRACQRLRHQQGGFVLLEAVVALGVIFVSLTGLLYSVGVGFVDIAFARQRQVGNQVADQIMEQVRALPYAVVAEGLSSSDLAGDFNILTCP